MSKWSGFHAKDHETRLALVAEHASLKAHEQALLSAPSALPRETAEALVENAVGTFPMPLGFAVQFVIDGREVVVPMAVEESSVIAAASHGAKLAARGGGFKTEAMRPSLIGQVEVRCKDPKPVMTHLQREEPRILNELNALIPGMVKRGGGAYALELRPLPGRVMVHIYVDVQDAMGANVVNQLCEAAWGIFQCPGEPGLRILSNYTEHQRLATATCRVPVEDLGGAEVAEAMVEANEVALLDAYRAVTHNKGIMNGIDPVLLATGNDWRAVEAGIHAYAARTGEYRGLTHYETDGKFLVARLQVPLGVGIVGGATRAHPVAQACLKILGVQTGPGLARVIVAVGLAQNLAALKALATEGIQKGHMALHALNLAMQAGLEGEDARRAADAMIAEGTVTAQKAREMAP